MTRSTFPVTWLARTAVLSLVLAASGLAGTAYANDEYGTNHETVIRQAAASAPKAPVDVASTARLSSGGPDVVGSGGAQDALARQIFHPGSGTDW